LTVCTWNRDSNFAESTFYTNGFYSERASKFFFFVENARELRFSERFEVEDSNHWTFYHAGKECTKT
jgi:hypothetical protein